MTAKADDQILALCVLIEFEKKNLPAPEQKLIIIKALFEFYSNHCVQDDKIVKYLVQDIVRLYKILRDNSEVKSLYKEFVAELDLVILWSRSNGLRRLCGKLIDDSKRLALVWKTKSNAMLSFVSA